MRRAGLRIDAIALIVAVHLLLVWCWPTRRHADEHARTGARMALFLIAPSRSRVVPMSPELAKVKPRKNLPADRPALTMLPSTASATAPSTAPSVAAVMASDAAPAMPVPPAASDAQAASLPADPFALPTTGAPRVDGTLARARADAGAIAKALRKASLDMAVRDPQFGKTALERGIASAFVQRGPPKLEELVMADGRRVTRVGGMCAFKEANGAPNGGHDVFAGGVRTIWARCAKVGADSSQ